MRRLSLHILFWAAYWLQDLLLQYTWMAPYLNEMPHWKQVWLAIVTATSVLLPKIAVVYYFLYRALPKLENGKGHLPFSIFEMIFVFISGILMFRLLAIYFIKPVLYNDHTDNSIFEIRSILVSILQIGFVTGIAVTIKFARIRLSEKERDKLLLKEKLETELKFLRNQTNPHFLMNTLNNIYALARKKSDEAPEAIMKLSELLQFILYRSTNRFITLAEEVRIIEHYLELEQLRYTQRLHIRFRREIDSGSYCISPLLLMPFVENAFKHGISETRFDSHINIMLEVRNGLLDFSIENSKENTALAKDKRNIGLMNVKRQLELTYKEYKMDISDEADVFKVRLFINLENHVEL